MNTFLQSRRQWLKRSSSGFGLLAFHAMLSAESIADSPQSNPLSPTQPHHQPRAKRVIFLNMEGGPSAQETFDPKPGESIFGFDSHGESGTKVTEVLPHLAKQVDKLCVLNGMHSDSSEHINASIQLHCGKSLLSRPSVGSWVTYGLGSENENLPGFIILNPSKVGAGSKVYSNAFLPGIYGGTPISKTLAVSDTTNGQMNLSQRRAMLDRAQGRTEFLMRQHTRDAHMNGLLNSYELGFRMQSALPGLLDVNQESKETLDAYGIDRGPSDSFGRQCLAARKLSESGVRFIELVHSSWDHHSALARLLPDRCREIDQPIAALLSDLDRHGLLEDTLVLWGGEFGRLKTAHHKNGGSGHNNRGYTMWMAGDGVKPGMNYGETDEEGHEAIAGKIHTHDLHATILHLLGLDHTRLTYRYAGRDFRLTDVAGRVVEEILA